MNRSFNYRKKQVEYLMPREEFLKRLGIPEPLANIYFSTANGTVKVICRGDK